MSSSTLVIYSKATRARKRMNIYSLFSSKHEIFANLEVGYLTDDNVLFLCRSCSAALSPGPEENVNVLNVPTSLPFGC